MHLEALPRDLNFIGTPVFLFRLIEVASKDLVRLATDKKTILAALTILSHDKSGTYSVSSKRSNLTPIDTLCCPFDTNISLMFILRCIDGIGLVIDCGNIGHVLFSWLTPCAGFV